MPLRPQAALFTPFGGLLVVAMLGIYACSAEEEPAAAKTTADVSADADGTATADGLPNNVTLTQAVDPYACPGGHLCACAADTECNSGFCIDEGSAKVCAEPCAPECSVGKVCKWLAKDGKSQAICVPVSDKVCNPCKSSDDCRAFGHGDAACVDHGPAGRFCGAACTGDASCGAGYRCAMVPVLDGGESTQCVPKAADGAPADSLGACTCSKAAIEASLSTDCYNAGFGGAKCWGSRTCGADGLGECTAAAAKSEACDGTDNDCDGQIDEDTCGDGEPCTADSCAGKDGCKNDAIDGPCNADNDVCTADDACKDGACAKGNVVVCDDGNGCTKDSCDSKKGCTYTSDASGPCDDGKKCTQGDGCVAGKCVPGKAKNCDDGKACTLDGCNPADGECTNTWTKGLLCDDGDACSHTDLCGDDQQCLGKAKNCDDGNVCTTDSCEQSSGCDNSPSQGGEECDDGDACTGKGSCFQGACSGAQATVCTASKICWSSTCSSATGKCVEAPSPSGAPCSDGDACTGGDACIAFQCKGTALKCDDDKPCTADSCNSQSGCVNKVKADLTTCEDGDKCTDSDKCVAGVCKGGPKTECDDKDLCTVDSCDKVKGCLTAPATDGTGCDDGDANTGPDVCAAGKCKSGPSLSLCKSDGDCDDKDACTDNKCTVATGKCNNSTKTDAACDDGDACTAGDKCGDKSGKAACLSGAVTKCDDGNACTTDNCDSKTGCQNVAVKDGQTCDDGDDCTTKDVCTAGKCAGGLPTAEVTRLAGSGPGAVDGTGKAASFKTLHGLALDSAGDIWIADAGNYKVRKMTAAGKVTTVAGQVSGFKDGAGIGTARFRAPADIAFDGSGNAYVADRTNHRIRKIVAGGMVSTLAGTAPTAPSNQVPSGGYGEGKGTAAKFNLPSGIVWSDAHKVLYVADQANHRVRKVELDGTVTTWAGDGAAGAKDGTGTAAQFNQPTGLAIDAAGNNLYVADFGGHLIRKVNQSGKVTTVAGSGNAGMSDAKGALAQFNKPWGMALDLVGNLLVADSGNHLVRVITLDDGAVATYAGKGIGKGDGPALQALFNTPTGIVADGKGNSYLADSANWWIRKIADPSKACVANKKAD